jgi:hypothetical protein
VACRFVHPTTSRSCRISCCAAVAARASSRSPSRYPLVEALSGLIAAALWITFVAGDPARAVAIRIARFAVYFAFSGVLIVLSFIDFATMRLPDAITLPAIPIFFLSGFAAHHAAVARPADRRRGRLSVPAHHRGLLLLRAQAGRASASATRSCWR